MTTKGSRLDYKFSSKNHWRRTIWNDVLRRTNGREKKEVILYLPGKDDLDRNVALSKGVPDNNLIAVEKNKENVKSLRKKGVNVIEGDLFSVVESWSSSKKICAILADICSGVEPSVLNIFSSISLRESARESVLMLNMQRGRDPRTSKLRDQTSNEFCGSFYGAMIDLYLDIPRKLLERIEVMRDPFNPRNFQIVLNRKDDCDTLSNIVNKITSGIKSQTKHRGKQFLYVILCLIVDNYRKHHYAVNEVSFIWTLLKCYDPVIMEYKSSRGNIVMDSIVINSPKGKAIYEDEDLERIRTMTKLSEKRKIAAALAIRTMRK
jgi:hypothetical protein